MGTHPVRTSVGAFDFLEQKRREYRKYRSKTLLDGRLGLAVSDLISSSTKANGFERVTKPELLQCAEKFCLDLP